MISKSIEFVMEYLVNLRKMKIECKHNRILKAFLKEMPAVC